MEYSFGLDSIVYIGETHSSKSHSYPIMVVCSKQGAFTLACDTEKARKDWLLVLNRVAIKEGGGTTSPDMCPWANVTVDYSPSSTPELPRHAYSEVSTILPNSSEDTSQGKPRTTTATGLKTDTDTDNNSICLMTLITYILYHLCTCQGRPSLDVPLGTKDNNIPTCRCLLYMYMSRDMTCYNSICVEYGILVYTFTDSVILVD